MFGRRGNEDGARPKPELRIPALAQAGSQLSESKQLPRQTDQRAVQQSAPQRRPEFNPPAPRPQREKGDSYYDTKSQVFSALIDTIDLSQLSKLDATGAREEIRDIVNDIIALKNLVMTIAEQEELLEDICNDVLGLGPLEPLLARDDIADIMVNGAKNVYIELSSTLGS